MKKVIKTISIIMAMEAEAAGLIKSLALIETTSQKTQGEPRHPFRFYESSVGIAPKITVTVLGKDPRYNVDNIGTEPAAVATFATVSKYKPDLLISAGTAGSFQTAGAEIGKPYLSRKACYFHDHRIPISGWSEFGNGAYPTFDVSKIANQLGIDQGDVSSGNSLDFTDKDLARIHANGAILKEMEAGAVAWVAFITETPIFTLKTVTNLIDTNPDSSTEFQKNFDVAVTSLTENLRAVLALF